MRRFMGWMCAAFVVAAFSTSAQGAERNSKKDYATFEAITPPSLEKVRLDSANWLKEVGQYDANRKAFDALWSDGNKSVLDKVAGTFALGDAEAAKLLSQARDPQAPAPTSATPSSVCGSRRRGDTMRRWCARRRSADG